MGRVRVRGRGRGRDRDMRRVRVTCSSLPPFIHSAQRTSVSSSHLVRG